MNEGIINRVKALEALCMDDPLYIKICNRETKEEKVVKVDEFLQMPEEFYMLRVVSGSSLKDLDKILNNMRKCAFMEAEEGV